MQGIKQIVLSVILLVELYTNKRERERDVYQQGILCRTAQLHNIGVEYFNLVEVGCGEENFGRPGAEFHEIQMQTFADSQSRTEKRRGERYGLFFFRQDSWVLPHDVALQIHVIPRAWGGSPRE